MTGIAVAKLIFSLLLLRRLQPEGSLRQINGPKTGGKAPEERRGGEQGNINAAMLDEEYYHNLPPSQLGVCNHRRLDCQTC